MRANSATIIGLSLAATLALAFIFALTTFRRTSKYKAKFDACDYVIFETEPSLLDPIEADLKALRWHLTESTPGDGRAMRYKFEKSSGHAASLSQIFDFGKSMPATANRRAGTDIVIKVKEYGTRRDLNA